MNDDASVMSFDATVAAAIRAFKSGMGKKLRAVFIDGPPGVGKNATAPYIATGVGLKHIFMLKMAHHEVPDIAGVPVPREDTQRTHFYASADMLPPQEPNEPYLMVHDEATDCNVGQMNLMCQMVHENRIHNYIFHPNTCHLLLGNRVQDRSGANRIITKLGNRCAHYTMQPTVDELFQYGARHGWNPTLLAFIKMRGEERINPSDNKANSPTYFNSFDPTDPAQMAKPQFASSRSYEFVSDYLNYVDEHEPGLDSGTLSSEIAGMVGTPVALAISGFRSVAVTMPDPDAILAGKRVAFPSKQEVMWALSLTLASKVKKENVKHMHAYLGQGPHEFLALAARIAFDTKVAALAGNDFNAMIGDPKIKAMFSAT